MPVRGIQSIKRATGYCVCGCHRPADELHHAVYQQHIRREGGDTSDPRVLVPVARECHARHHNRQRPFSLHVLPTSVFDFARELMGTGPAYEYLRRRYVGTDGRLDALLPPASARKRYTSVEDQMADLQAARDGYNPAA